MDPVQIVHEGKTYEFPASAYGQRFFKCGGSIVEVRDWQSGKPKSVCETAHPSTATQIGKAKVCLPVQS